MGAAGIGTTAAAFAIPGADIATGVSMVSGGQNYFCALFTASKGVRCWGSGAAGALGNGASGGSVLTVPTSDVITGVLAVQTGTQHTCVIMAATYGLRCWGQGSAYQLGNGVAAMVLAPPPSDVFAGPVAQMALGLKHTCVLMASYAVRCWGDNVLGQCGVASSILSVNDPPGVDLISGVSAIASGANHVCVIMHSTAGLRCWGDNGVGQLGIGSMVAAQFSVSPADQITGVAQVALGRTHSCVVMLANGGVRCWGSNTEGELGLGFSGGPLRSIANFDVATGYAQLSLGNSFTCGIISVTGGVRCWGNL